MHGKVLSTKCVCVRSYRDALGTMLVVLVDLMLDELLGFEAVKEFSIKPGIAFVESLGEKCGT